MAPSNITCGQVETPRYDECSRGDRIGGAKTTTQNPTSIASWSRRHVCNQMNSANPSGHRVAVDLGCYAVDVLEHGLARGRLWPVLVRFRRDHPDPSLRGPRDPGARTEVFSPVDITAEYSTFSNNYLNPSNTSVLAQLRVSVSTSSDKSGCGHSRHLCSDHPDSPLRSSHCR